MAVYERLSPEDTSFLYMESPTSHMHVGSLLICEDTSATYDDICAHIESRLHLAPKFRKKLMWVPFNAGRPIWIDDPSFDLRYHIRATGLAAPGGKKELLDLTARLMSTQLDRERPLWEIWLVDMPGDKRAVIQKTHHSMIDGISGVDIVTVLLDLSADVEQTDPVPWAPEDPPAPSSLLVDTIRERLTMPSEVIREVSKLAKKPEKLAEIGSGLIRFGKDSIDGAPKTSLEAPVGAYRRFDVLEVSLADVKKIKNAASVKVNDVVLTIVAGGLRNLLLSRGDVVTDLNLRAMVPVSVRGKDPNVSIGNQVSAMFADLPIGIADAHERLSKIATWMDGVKNSGEALGAQSIIKLGDFMSPTFVSLASRLAIASAVSTTNLVITNVPGPQFPLYFMGGELTNAYPYLGPVGSMPIAIAVVSYDGKMEFGIAADWDAGKDISLLSEGIEKSVAALLD